MVSDVESALMVAGWVSTNRDAHDQRYYRQWMHEIPPLRHMGRGAVLDVHHTILPLTARVTPDASLLLAAAEPVQADGSVRALSPADQVLHSAAHLFHEGELEMGLRGLIDLDALLQANGAADGFWNALMDRAAVLDLRWPLLSDAWTPTARLMLCGRGHWLRMPPGLLAWHLLPNSLTGWPSPATEP